MKIAILTDKVNSAIFRLSESIKKYNPHFLIDIVTLHPKRPSIEEIDNVEKVIGSCDVLHVNYWKSGEKFKEIYPKIFKEKKKILHHHNPYDLMLKNWKEDYDVVVTHNQTMLGNLPYSKFIPQGIDLDFWTFGETYDKDNLNVLMVCARIEGKKGILEVAKVCKKFGYVFNLVGRISDQNYFDLIKNEGVVFHENITDEELKVLYQNSAFLVCNSVDNFESGPMPVLEAMACGLPVLTRKVGHIMDLFNGGNLELLNTESGDEEGLAEAIKGFMLNPDLRINIRERAFDTVKNRNAKKMARQYSAVYYSLLYDRPLVSIIIPTFNRPESLVLLLVSIFKARKNYSAVEIVVADSGDEDIYPIIERFKEKAEIPIKYIRFENLGEYTLPKARNLAVIESQGSILMFCDDRLEIDENAISEFAENARAKTWLWGVKDDYEKSFVENFSCVLREDLVRFGMFNERIDRYGGQTQDIRSRYGRNGFTFELISRAKAKSTIKSGSKFRKRKDIIEAKFILYKLYGEV